MLNSSAGVFGTRRIIIFRPSVDPMPIDANDRIDVASENSLPDPLQSPNTKEFVRGNDNNVCNCGEVYDEVRCVVGVNEPSFLSTWVSVEAREKKIKVSESRFKDYFHNNFSFDGKSQIKDLKRRQVNKSVAANLWQLILLHLVRTPVAQR